MRREYGLWDTVRFSLKVLLLNVLTFAFALFVMYPQAPSRATHVMASRSDVQAQSSRTPAKPIIEGTPVRIVIPASGVDLTVDPGVYDPGTNSWTLSGYHAQFATISAKANDLSGDTFIYGHNNNYVFGALRHQTPAVGSQALIYTDNGHVFSYLFESVASVVPTDTSVFTYTGPPKLTIQTCTGSMNEWRTLYRYNFEKVVQ